MEGFGNGGESYLRHAGEPVALDAVGDRENIRLQLGGPRKRRRRVLVAKPDAQPADEIPRCGIFIARERLLREIRRGGHVGGAVGEPRGEPEPSGIDRLPQ